jgi:tripartite-type tricarboxylate transporter receptor subunit TctC
LPEVPSAGALGHSDLIVNNWNAFLVPAGTPAAIVARLHDAIVEAGNEPALIAAVRQAGAEISISTPAAASALLAADLARLTRIAKETGIKIE